VSKGLFTLRTLTDVDDPKGRTSTSVTACQLFTSSKCKLNTSLFPSW